MYKYILYILYIIYYILYIIYHIYIYNINMYQPVTKWDDPGIDPLMKFGIQWEGSICVALRIFHHKRWWSKVVWSEPCWESHQCPLINLLNHAFELVVQKVSLQFVRFGILGFVKFLKDVDEEWGSEEKMLDIGHFSPVFEWGKLSSTMGPQWQNQALELFFFFFF